MDPKAVLTALQRHKSIIIAVPVLAVLAVVGMLVLRPKQYQATATVSAPALVGGSETNQYSGANGAKSFVANFTTAVSSPPVVAQVARETGAPAARVKTGVSATEIGTSTLMRVTYKTSKRSEAQSVVRAAASDTIVFLFRTQVQLAQQPLQDAQAALTDVENQVATLSAQTSLVVPDKDYEVRAQQIANLQSAQAQAQANGHGPLASALSARLDQLRSQLAAIAPQVQQFGALAVQKKDAVKRLNDAQHALSQAESQLAAADPSRVVSVAKTSAISLTGDLAQKAAAAAGAGLFLALGIVAVLEVLDPSRQSVDLMASRSEWTTTSRQRSASRV